MQWIDGYNELSLKQTNISVQMKIYNTNQHSCNQLGHIEHINKKELVQFQMIIYKLSRL